MAKKKKPTAPPVDEKTEAINGFVHRTQNPPVKIDNSSLYAGSPMYYYCNDCGDLAQTLPECHTQRPDHTCKKCKVLISNGWMPEAKAKAKVA